MVIVNGNSEVHIEIVNIYLFPKSTDFPFGWLHSNSNGIRGISATWPHMNKHYFACTYVVQSSSL